MYLTRKASLRVIFHHLENKMASMSHQIGVMILKMPYISLIIGNRASKCEIKTLQEDMAYKSFASVKFSL